LTIIAELDESCADARLIIDGDEIAPLFGGGVQAIMAMAHSSASAQIWSNQEANLLCQLCI